MKNFIKISNMAAMLGISPNGLRKYEEYGIVSPSSSEDTGHRKYKMMDLPMLINVRRYRQFGYPLEEIVSMLNEEELSELRQKHFLYLEQKEEEIQQIRCKIKRMEEVIELIDEARFGIKTMRTCVRPAMWLLPVINEGKFLKSNQYKNISGYWISHIPSACISCILPKDIIKNPGTQDYKYMFSIFEEDALVWKLKMMNQVHQIPAEFCIKSYHIQNHEEETLHEAIKPLLNFVQENKLGPGGDIITRGVLFAKKLYREVWIPIHQSP